MIISFGNNFTLVATLRDHTARRIEELKTDDEKILRAVADTGEVLDISDIEFFIVNGTPRTKQDTFYYLDTIFI